MSVSLYILQYCYLPITEDRDTVIMIPSRKKFLMMVDGYTYSQYHSTGTWLCSSLRVRRCPARVLRQGSGTISRLHDHNHPRPHYVYKNGSYIKI